MPKNFSKILFSFIISQIFIFVLLLLLNGKISLVDYINLSFYVASLMLFSSLILFTVSTGFFDAITDSFRVMFNSNERRNGGWKNEERILLSQMINVNYSPVTAVGFLNLFFMSIALVIYYL